MPEDDDIAGRIHLRLVLQTLEDRARFSKNDLHVWMAMSVCFANNSPFPDWVLEQVKVWTMDMRSLIDGHDFRTPPTPGPNESAEAFADRYSRPTISTEEASRLVMAALRLSSQGKNAFNNYRRDQARELESLRIDAVDAFPGIAARHPIPERTERKKWGRIKDGYGLRGTARQKKKPK